MRGLVHSVAKRFTAVDSEIALIRIIEGGQPFNGQRQAILRRQDDVHVENRFGGQAGN
jgi:hypothetical protein